MQPSHNWSFLVDEDLPASLVAELRNQRYQAEHIYDAGLQGHSDEDVFQYAQTHQQAIITNDLDFSNIKQYTPPHHGIIVLRLANSVPPAQRNHHVLQAIQQLQGQQLENTLVIVELQRIRVRR